MQAGLDHQQRQSLQPVPTAEHPQKSNLQTQTMPATQVMQHIPHSNNHAIRQAVRWLCWHVLSLSQRRSQCEKWQSRFNQSFDLSRNSMNMFASPLMGQVLSACCQPRACRTIIKHSSSCFSWSHAECLDSNQMEQNETATVVLSTE